MREDGLVRMNGWMVGRRLLGTLLIGRGRVDRVFPCAL